MTNEEKATKISEKYENWWAMEAPDVSGASFESAMAMAEWKDQQFTDVKKRFIEYLESALQGGVHPQGIKGFIEQFKQAMEE